MPNLSDINLNTSPITIKTSIANHTLTTDNINSIIGLSGSLTTSPTLSVIVPNNNFVQGYQVTIIRLGLGPVTIFAQPGVTIRSAANNYNLAYQYSIASLVYTGNPTIGWIAYGDLI